MEVISDKILDGYDKYVLGQLPANFDPDGIYDDTEDTEGPSSGKKMMKEMPPPAEYQSLDENDDELMRKLQEEGEKNIGGNLIDFEEVNEDDQDHTAIKTQEESLI